MGLLRERILEDKSSFLEEIKRMGYRVIESYNVYNSGCLVVKRIGEHEGIFSMPRGINPKDFEGGLLLSLFVLERGGKKEAAGVIYKRSSPTEFRGEVDCIFGPDDVLGE